MAQIIDNNKNMKEFLESMNLKEGIYVDVNLEENGSLAQERKGLDYALNFNGEESPIILYSWESPRSLFEDKRFMKLMSKKDTRFARLPFSKNDLERVLSMPTFDNKALDIVSSRIEEDNTISQLKHKYKNDPSSLVGAARNELRLDGSDKEIIDYLNNYQSKRENESLGKIPGVFVDSEGTLLNEDGSLNENLAYQIIEYSNSHPVNIWTGGDVNDISKKLGSQFYEFCMEHDPFRTVAGDSPVYSRTPILSKYTFRNSEPGIVIDDMEEDDFREAYGINPQQYFQAKSNRE